MPSGTLGDSIKIIICCIVAASVYVYTNSFATKPIFTDRAKKIYSVTMCYAVVSVIPIAVIFKEKTAVFVLCGIKCIIPVYTFLSLISTRRYFEKKNETYIKKQLEKLADMRPVKIGITGSFGKTTCKNILLNMLSKRYKTIATESNFNTPMGLALTIDKSAGDEEVFIAEMGARRRGDIKLLCDMFKPDIGIITGVCEQHIKTFGSLHEVYLEKSELSRHSKMCVFNGNDKHALKMFRERKSAKFKTCVDKEGDVYADNITVGAFGSKFDLHIKNAVYRTQTCLLGRHNLQNILTCVAVAKYLDISDEDILQAIEELPQVPHRLEYSFGNGIHIIDDGYNSNEIGVKYAMEVLDSFDGRKVVVSQGLTECGKKTKLLNENVGRTISGHADVVITCGSNGRHIRRGLVRSGYAGKIYNFKTLKIAQKQFAKILQKGDVLLLQNDLPDIY